MRHDPAAAAIVIMLRSLKMYGMAQAAGELMEQCRSPIEMSPVSPIEMSLRQAVVETFGVTCDDGDPNERSRTDPASYHDRPGGRADHS
jgi:hypothetical protein